MTEVHRVELGGKAAIELEVHRGQVVGAQKWSETHVHSSGSRSWVGPQGGYVHSPSVHSSVTNRNEIWIRDHGSGREYALPMQGDHVRYREGQEVAVLVGRLGQRRETLQVFNLATQMFNCYNKKVSFLAKDALGPGPSGWPSLLVSALISVVAYFVATYLAQMFRGLLGDMGLSIAAGATLLFVCCVVVAAMNRSSREANRVVAASQRIHHAMEGIRNRVNDEAGLGQK